jgi:hypothetical protein
MKPNAKKLPIHKRRKTSIIENTDILDILKKQRHYQTRKYNKNLIYRLECSTKL